MDNYDNKFMEIAYKEALKAYNKDDVPVGAVIVKDNKIIGKAFNKKDKSNCVIDHAEIIAIKKVSKKMSNWRLDDCDIYVTLEPCPMCASALEQARVRNIFTGCVNKNCEKITKQILKEKEKEKYNEKCEMLIKKFFKEKR